MAEKAFSNEVAVMVVGTVAATAAVELLSRLAAWATARLPPEAWSLILRWPDGG